MNISLIIASLIIVVIATTVTTSVVVIVDSCIKHDTAIRRRNSHINFILSAHENMDIKIKGKCVNK